MRPVFRMKRTRRAQVAAGVMTLMVPATAYALSAGSAPAYAGPPAAPGSVSASGTTGAVRAATRHVRAHSRFAVRPRTIEALGGQVVHVRGHLLPAFAGSKIRLQGLFAGQWRTLASTRTGSRGGFLVRYPTSGTGQHRLRVLFGGDRKASLARAGAGSLTVFTPTVASWYDDGGDTACGFHAYYGVANKSLPCGTKVKFAYNGRTVTATVDDRGPFVAGRDYDLNQNTAGALGFGGVDTVWSSVQ
jgi:rare lipoprotein A